MGKSDSVTVYTYGMNVYDGNKQEQVDTTLGWKGVYKKLVL